MGHAREYAAVSEKIAGVCTLYVSNGTGDKESNICIDFVSLLIRLT
jgi:hypothetical protein